MTGEERPLSIKLTNPGNIDWYYGSGNTAYNTVQDAINTVPEAIRLGKTVGVLSGNTLVELWWSTGTTDNDLVVKTNGAANVDLSDYYTKEQSDSKYLTGYTVDFSNYYDKATSDSRFQPVGYYLTGLTSDLVTSALTFTPENAANKNIVNGYAGLNSSGLIPLNLFPDKLLGNVKYKGTYDGNTISSSDSALNGLALPVADSGNTGYYFILTSGITYSGVTFNVGDWIISDGSAGWNRVQNSDAVTTVFGRNGNIVANSSDYAAYYLPVSSGATITANTASITSLQNNVYTKSQSDAKYLTGITSSGITQALGYTPESGLTFNNGLTRSGNTISNNLITGIAGGQTIYGGTASSNSLTLSSTANAAKGKILFGTSAYDELNNVLAIGANSAGNFMSTSIPMIVRAVSSSNLGGFLGIEAPSGSTGFNIKSGGLEAGFYLYAGSNTTNNRLFRINNRANTLAFETLNDAGTAIGNTVLNINATGSTTTAFDVEITNATKGIILRDAGDGTRRRITVVNGVLTVSAPL